ncbi:MAG: ABC transporter ATP-binding protein, partial [Bacillota bacterium]
MTLFSEIHQNGTAILLVTHDAKVAARAQRVLFMRDGRIVSELSPRDWTSRYLAGKTKQVLLEIQRLEI